MTRSKTRDARDAHNTSTPMKENKRAAKDQDIPFENEQDTDHQTTGLEGGFQKRRVHDNLDMLEVSKYKCEQNETSMTTIRALYEENDELLGSSTPDFDFFSPPVGQPLPNFLNSYFNYHFKTMSDYIRAITFAHISHMSTCSHTHMCIRRNPFF